mgnify:FL=1
MGRLGLLCSRRFYSNRVCTNLVVASCFVCLVLHWVVAPLICNLGYGGLSFDTGGGAGRRKGDPPIAEHAFCRNNSCPVLPAVLLSNFMESRSRAMGDALCNGRINWLVLLIPLVYLVLAAVPLLCCPRAFGRGQGDVFARSVLVAVPIGLVPAVEVAYFASDAAVIASLSMGSAIAVAAFVCTSLREKRDNNSDTPRTSDPFDAGVFSPALSPREEQFVRLLLKGKTPAEIARETGTKPSTVRTTLHRAYGKASVAGSRELVALFAGEGDATGPGLLQRHAGDMLTSVRTRRLFRYLLTTFFILLAAGPLVMADSDWGSGVSRAVAFSLASYALGLGLLLSLHYAGEN